MYLKSVFSSVDIWPLLNFSMVVVVKWWALSLKVHFNPVLRTMWLETHARDRH